MTVSELIELLKLSPLDKDVMVQTVDGRFNITGTSDHHQHIEFNIVMIDTEVVERFGERFR